MKNETLLETLTKSIMNPAIGEIIGDSDDSFKSN